MAILVLASSNDEGVASVLGALDQRGAPWLRLDTDRFPGSSLLAVHQGRDEDRLEVQGIRLDTIRSVWIRRPLARTELPDSLDAKYRSTCLKESALFLEGMTYGLGAFHLDPSAKLGHADNKLRQHALARTVGLEIPRTVVTNDREVVLRFAQSAQGGLICKMIHRARLYEDYGDYVHVPTTALTAEDLGALEGLHLCPMIFQERVPKALELRVTVVGRSVFSAASDTQAHDGCRDDWRVDQDELTWVPHALPQPVEAALLRLMDHFGLNYGAADFIRTPDGRYLFLELNPRGEFTWIEEQTGFPISEAIADLLVGRVAPRV